MTEFKIKLSDFEGPLDLLLGLLKKNKIEIEDIDINIVSKQFIDLVNNSINDIPINEFSDYLYMISTLISIKSKSLLPSYNSKDNKINFDQERDDLIKRLIEYDKYKNSLSFFESSLNSRKLIFDKSPEDYDDYQLEQSNLEKLPSKLSISRLHQLFENIVEEIIIKNINENQRLFKENVEFSKISIKELQLEIIHYLKSSNDEFINLINLFYSCFKGNVNINYFCNYFLAILVLIRNGIIKIKINDNDSIDVINNINVDENNIILEEI